MDAPAQICRCGQTGASQHLPTQSTGRTVNLLPQNVLRWRHTNGFTQSRSNSNCVTHPAPPSKSCYFHPRAADNHPAKFQRCNLLSEETTLRTVNPQLCI